MMITISPHTCSTQRQSQELVAILEGLLRFAHVHNRLILLFTILLSRSDSIYSSEYDLDD